VSVTIIVALTIPLAITLDRRARAELERESLVRAGTIAQDVGAENLALDRRPTLRTLVSRAAERTDGRVIVVDASGSLIADSQGPATGVNYDTPQRPEVAAALNDVPTSMIRFSQDLGVDIMATAVPIVDESSGTVATVVGAVRITQSMDQVNAAVRRVRLGVIGIGVGGLLAGFVLALALSGSLARPLGRLADAAQRFGSGDLAVRAGDIRGPDEVERLAASFDQMAGQVQATVQAQREFAANASHQLRTPLTGMKLRLESAIADTDDEDVRSELVQTEVEVDRLSAIVDRLLTTASRTEAKPTGVIDLAQVATHAVERWDARAREAQTDLVAEVRTAPALVDARDVGQIIDNLLDNAIAYAPGRVEVGTGIAEGRAFVAVQDHGPGVAESDFPHITERFYRGEGRRVRGSGLGLAIVQELAKQANGAVAITQPTGGGTRIEVRYPPVS
jgi:signal transduction histidine kinase